jgi:hypothetical protein
VFSSAGSAASVVIRFTGWLTRPPRFWLGSRSPPCSARRLAAVAGAATTGWYPPSGTRDSGSNDLILAGSNTPATLIRASGEPPGSAARAVAFTACAVTVRYGLSSSSTAT